MRSSGPPASAASGSARAASARTSWSRTRSRSSWLAARPNVTTSSCSSGMPASATYRVTSAPIVQVLPVPALASSSVVPVGNGPVMLKVPGVVIAAPHVPRR